MKCKDFDAHIDEMLSGILHPDANQHMRQCERCTSHLRSRATVQSSLRQLASATLPGPSRATDRAVMDGYRRLQQRRAVAGNAVPAMPVQNTRQRPRILTFPGRVPAAAGGLPGGSPNASRTWFTSAAAAAVVFAVLGSAVHLWNGVPTVSAPTVATAPAAAASALAQPAPASDVSHSTVAVNLSPRHSLQRPAQLSSRPNASQPEALSLAASNSHVPTADRAPLTQLPANASPVIRLASSGAASGTASSMAQSASSTWPGYSNLMYCDPVVCSGPMQVVHIKVPVGQVNPNLGQAVGNGFVNAEVVVGPDGVARAIRVAN
jgi:hypothetical protein